jgi:hypothetical protein
MQVQRSSDEVPAPVKAHVEQQVSASLGDVKVHRSPESASTARQIKARAFTTGGEIHLPAEHGPLDREPGRSLVAHELVHVAQQRQLGPSLPTEDSHHGRELESQAQRVEVATARSDSPLVLARKPDTDAVAEAAVQRAVERAQSSSGRTSYGTVQPGVSILQRAIEINEVTTSVNSNSNSNSNTDTSPPPATPTAPASNAPTGPAAASSSSSDHAPDPLSGMPGGHSHTEGPALQENQLRQAWTYVRARISEELTDDRERAGLTIDLS